MHDPHKVEMTNYWRAVQQITEERRKSTPDEDVIEDGLSELEGIILHTKSPSLRARCQAFVSREETSIRLVQAP